MIYLNQHKVFDFHLFADDTSFFMSHEKLETLESEANNELVKISDWLIANKLSLNTKKSNFSTIYPKNKMINRKMEIFINNETLTEGQTVKYLGVLIGNKLSWKAHIQQNNLKISKCIGILANIRHHAPKNIFVNI